MKKPAHTPTKSIRGDAQPQEKGKTLPRTLRRLRLGCSQPPVTRNRRPIVPNVRTRPARTNGMSVRTHVRLDREVTRVHHDGAVLLVHASDAV